MTGTTTVPDTFCFFYSVFFIEVDLGFGTTVEQYLRLRGIDSPEIDTKEGKEAQAFVRRELKDVPFILLQSSRSDPWGRYLADVFYTVKGEERFLNNLLLKKGLAHRYDPVSLVRPTVTNLPP